ncbi:BON domain-containing protein [Flavobacterium sp. 7A]|uniref:BON domain-containing protein n=1 Tax=Flavobacterium sp. 7A TaxID=2940571 RepID=UPI0022262278|nr:BON domain-containing protein [Flavobacterium sp. 7A]MCW2119157.1 osmotically-inducible protein OsmY [Flavobacterium sp. 7A]
MKNNEKLQLGASIKKKRESLISVIWNDKYRTQVSEFVCDNLQPEVDAIYTKKTNSELTDDVKLALKLNHWIPQGNISIKADEGWVTLEGELTCSCQKDAVRNVLSALSGIIGVTDNIKIKSKTNNVMQEKEIEEAIFGNGLPHNIDISVKVIDTTAILSGTVNSWDEKEKIGRIAWSSSGIWLVKNELQISSY